MASAMHDTGYMYAAEFQFKVNHYSSLEVTELKTKLTTIAFSAVGWARANSL